MYMIGNLSATAFRSGSALSCPASEPTPRRWRFRSPRRRNCITGMQCEHNLRGQDQNPTLIYSIVAVHSAAEASATGCAVCCRRCRNSQCTLLRKLAQLAVDSAAEASATGCAVCCTSCRNSVRIRLQKLAKLSADSGGEGSATGCPLCCRSYRNSVCTLLQKLAQLGADSGGEAGASQCVLCCTS